MDSTFSSASWSSSDEDLHLDHHLSSDDELDVATILLPSQLTPTYIDHCLKINPTRAIKVDILGDTVELPIYAMRRRNALAHL